MARKSPAWCPALGFGAVSVSLSGCAAWSPEGQGVPMLAVPASWSTAAAPISTAATSPAPLAHWWQRFNDPLLSTLVPLFFLGGIQLLSLGVIGEYVAKTYMETKARPRYIIDREV